jgi:hypothetical protein
MRIASFGEPRLCHSTPMGRRMSKEGMATIKNASMGSLCHRRKPEEILSDLQVEWVKLALTIELENAIRRRFPGHSEGTYGRLERWIDGLAFLRSDARFRCETLWRAIVSWFAARRTR